MFSNLQAELERYFNGETVQFTAALDWPIFLSFKNKFTPPCKKWLMAVLSLMGIWLRRIGSPGAARAVGTALHNNPLPSLCLAIALFPAAGIGGFAAADAQEGLAAAGRNLRVNEFCF